MDVVPASVRPEAVGEVEWVPELIDWYAGAARELPWRRAGFGAWGVLVSEFMLQQTPVTRVDPPPRGVADPLADTGGV